jgi:triacylglycerol lipase
MLHALDVAVNMQLYPVMYNFGGPRVGNPEFTAAYTRRVPDSFRIVNAYDIIPLFPPRVLGASLNGQRRLWFYQHVQGKKRIRAQTGSIRGNHAITTYLGALRSQS